MKYDGYSEVVIQCLIFSDIVIKLWLFLSLILLSITFISEQKLPFLHSATELLHYKE